MIDLGTIAAILAAISFIAVLLSFLILSGVVDTKFVTPYFHDPGKSNRKRIAKIENIIYEIKDTLDDMSINNSQISKIIKKAESEIETLKNK